MSELVSLLVAGVVTGSIYAVSATGLVVTYTTTGVFNFAHGAVGMVLAYVFWQLWQGWHLPAAAALVLTLVVAAPLLGLLVEVVVMRPLQRSPLRVRLGVTLGLLLVLVAGAESIWPQGDVYNVPEFFNGHTVKVAGVTFSIEQLLTVGVAVVCAVALRLLFTRTTTGLAMRAVVDDPGLARLAGTSATRISAYAWMLGTFFAGLAGILLAPTTMSPLVLTELVIYGYAAAVVGRLRSIPLTFLGAMVLGIANNLAIGYVPTGAKSDVTAALPMAMLLVVLLVLPEVRLAVGRLPRTEILRPASLRNTLVGGAAVLVVCAALAAVLQGDNLVTLGDVLVLALAGLSLVPLSGWAGQVSLCQFTFLGLGALTAHWLGGDSVVGVLGAVGLCAGAGAVVALPVLRLRGLYLALATLAFAVLMDNVFFTSTAIMGSGGTVSVGRPAFLAGTRGFDVMLAVVLVACLVGVGALRRGRFGRRLVASDASPAGYATLGLGLSVTKLAVFAFSAALAGLAGALYGGLSGAVGAAQFQFLQSVVLFVAVTLAGGDLLSASIAAGVFLGVGPVLAAHVPQVPNLVQLLAGIGIVSIGRNPAGVGQVFLRFGRRRLEPARA